MATGGPQWPGYKRFCLISIRLSAATTSSNWWKSAKIGHALWIEYLGKMPPSFQEVFRSIVYHSLSTEPPTPITFAWAPGYDYELSLWQSPDTPPTKGGITLLMKSRYPSDPHPADGTGSYPETKQ
jgi:hypothetical protein